MPASLARSLRRWLNDESSKRRLSTAFERRILPLSRGDLRRLLRGGTDCSPCPSGEPVGIMLAARIQLKSACCVVHTLLSEHFPSGPQFNRSGSRPPAGNRYVTAAQLDAWGRAAAQPGTAIGDEPAKPIRRIQETALDGWSSSPPLLIDLGQSNTANRTPPKDAVSKTD